MKDRHMTTLFEKLRFCNSSEKEQGGEYTPGDSGIHLKEIKSNLPTFDEAIGHYATGQLITVAGLPYSGNRDLIVSLITGLAVDYSVPVALFSLEMSDMQIAKKTLMNVFESDINGQTVGDENVTYEFMERLNSAPIYVDDTPAISLHTLRERIIEYSTQVDIRIVFIDNIQLISEYKNAPEDTLHEIKHIAEETQVTIISLFCLKRPPQINIPLFVVADNITALERLMQYADTVAILQRLGCYSKTIASALPELTTMCVLKNPDGILSSIDLCHNTQICKFTEYKLD